MYCSSCGVPVAPGLSYCNQCGTKLTVSKGDTANKSSEVRPEALIWAMVAVLVFGFVAIMFLMMAMKMAGLDTGQILGFTSLSFLMMMLVEGVFIWQLLRRTRGAAEAVKTALPKDQATKELDVTQARVLPEGRPSVTEHTTHLFEPSYIERKSK